jgi:predicted lipid carrier protein YhbT
VATEQECDVAFHLLADLLAALDPEVFAKYVITRTVSCKVTDLGITWSGQLCDDGLVDITTADVTKAQIRCAVNSDDLLALIAGKQPIPSAWATGRLRIQAGPRDMLRLTSLFSIY